MADKAKLLQVAQKHLSKGNLDKAIKTFKQLVEVDPRDQRLILRLADIQARAGRKKEAIENYEKVAAGYIKQDFPPKAIAVYKTILRLDPELLSAYEKLAQLYKNQGLEAEALSQFENLFQVYERKNDENKQIDVLKLMADMDPENLGFQVRLGETLAKKGRKKEAAEAFAKAAATLSRRGFHDRASQLFEKITALNPDNTAVRRELCAHYLESGQFNEARAEIEAILAIEPDDPRMVLLLGRILFQLGNKAEGEEKLGQSIQLFLDSGELESVMREFLFVAQSHLRNGEVDEAEAFYRQIMNNVPGEVRAIKGLVAVAEKRKDRVGQIDNLLFLGRTMQQSGDREGALNAYRKVNELDPLNEEAKGFIEEAEHLQTPAGTVRQDLRDSVGLEGEVSDDLIEEIDEIEEVEEVEEVALLSSAEGILEDVSEQDLEEEVEIFEEEGPDQFVLTDEEPQAQILEEEGLDEFVLADEETQTQILEEELEEEEIPEIVIEEFEDVEEEIEISPGAELDTAPAAEVEEPIVQEEEPAAEELSLEELLAEADVYERYGLSEKAAETLEKARALAPGDQTVLDRITAFESGVQTAVMPPTAAAPPKGAGEAGGSAQDPFEEDLEEADFYHSQGLDDEASRIYRSILKRDPKHQRASQALTVIEEKGAVQAPGEPDIPVQAALDSQFDPGSARELKSKLIVKDAAPEEMDGFLDIADDLRMELADEMGESSEASPEDGPVSFEEIFSQFKKGIEETLGDEEYETHYNLGIAYKDMGLYDDAIREFESGARDPALAQDSFSLMAMCYTEKKEYDAAVKAVEQALEVSSEGNRTGLFYQLGQIREKLKHWSEAASAYEQVQASDPAFEGIDEALGRVKALVSQGAPDDGPDEAPAEGGMDDMLSDLIKEVEEMARESSGEPADDPGKSKKDRISYL